MGSDAVVLGLRVLLSLACVFALMWYLSKRMSGTAAVRRRRSDAVTVVGRQSLGGKSGLALVEVSGRRLLIGVSEHGVNLLTELESVPEPELGRAERTELDPVALELAAMGDLDVPLDLSGLDDFDHADDADDRSNHAPAPALLLVPRSSGFSAGSTTAVRTVPQSTPAARMPAVPKPRNPLEGSILDAATWRRAVVAVQERTIRR